MDNFGIINSLSLIDEYHPLMDPAITQSLLPIPLPMTCNFGPSLPAELQQTNYYSESYQPFMAGNPSPVGYGLPPLESRNSNISTEFQMSNTIVEVLDSSPGSNISIASRRHETTKEDRLRIQTALDLGLSVSKITEQLGFSRRQIYYVRNHGVEPGKKRCGRKPALNEDKAQELVGWLHSNPQYRHAPPQMIPNLAPELGLNQFGKKAIRTAFKSQGYGRRVSKKKGFSHRPEHMQRRLEFAMSAFHWSPQRLSEQIFSDEVWAHGGANSRRFVTVLVEGDRQEILFDRFRPECLTPKYGKLPAWMFHGIIHNGRKALGTFWEKEYGTMDSAKYDAYILSQVQRLVQYERSQGRDTWYQHDNAACHRSRLTQDNLRRREIKTIDWPPYSPDLNLIEHVWAKMKRYIQDHYSLTGYDPRRVGNEELRRIIQEAWDAVPDEFISDLYASWQDRCKAVIDARGGPTKY